MFALCKFNAEAQLSKPKFIPSQQSIPFKIIVGELKGIKGNFDAHFKIISQQSSEFPYDVILEKDASFCFFMNLFISGRDTNIFKYVRISGKEEEDFYRKLYSLNKDRGTGNKINIKSFDIEHSNNFQTCLNAIYYMISQVSNESIQRIADTVYYNPYIATHLKANNLLRIIDSTRLAFLITHDSVLQEIRTNLKLTLSYSSPYTKSWYKKREKMLLELFNKATYKSVRFCVITQTIHMPKSGGRNAFLNDAKLKKLGIECIYPIYFNKYLNSLYKKTFYCTHPKNPFFFSPKKAQEFSSKKGAWILSNKNNYYLVISN
jgi:hypothetical protein